MLSQSSSRSFRPLSLVYAPLAGRGLCSSLLVLLALGAVQAAAATITVSGTCTLAEAINSANLDASYSGPCVAGSGDDTISLTDSIVLSATPTAIASNVVLAGNSKILDGNNLVRILSITSGIVTIENITITRGNANDSGGGGAIYKTGGTLTVNDSSLVANKTTGIGTPGGAINNTAGPLTLNRTQFMGNVATSSGGAISSSGPLEINKCTFGYDATTASGNKANVYGGAIQVSNSALNIYDSTFDRNIGNAGGGAVYVTAGSGFNISGTINNSTFIRNQTSFITADADGGAIFIEPVNGGSINTIFKYNTIVRNRGFNGGGIHTHVNTTATLHGNLIAGNTFYIGTGEGDGCVDIKGASNCANEVLNLGNLSTSTTSNNLLGRNTETIAQALIGYTPSSTDICATSDAGVNCISKPTLLNSMISSSLTPEWNGGPTQTVALVEGGNNPAIDAIATGGSDPTCASNGSTLDQRGYKRANKNAPGDQTTINPQPGYGNDKCDIGAYEFTAKTQKTPQVTASSARIPGVVDELGGRTLQFNTTWTNSSAGPLHNVVYKLNTACMLSGANCGAVNGAVVDGVSLRSVGWVLALPNDTLPTPPTWDNGESIVRTFKFWVPTGSTGKFRWWIDQFADPAVKTLSVLETAVGDEPIARLRLDVEIDENGVVREITPDDAADGEQLQLPGGLNPLPKPVYWGEEKKRTL